MSKINSRPFYFVCALDGKFCKISLGANTTEQNIEDIRLLPSREVPISLYLSLIYNISQWGTHRCECLTSTDKLGGYKIGNN